MKKFLISIDTEGDNLWNWHEGDAITTECVEYLPRFQELCEKYNFKPTYLTNWEVMNDRRYVDWVKPLIAHNKCEIGMHLHAWNNPPLYDLPRSNPDAQEYLIEYNEKAMEEKIARITNAIVAEIGVRPITHRAGRWAMDDRYYRLLAKHGYVCDCSVTPGIDWSICKGSMDGSKGSDYSRYPNDCYKVDCGDYGSILEVPLTTTKTNRFIAPDTITPYDVLRQLKHWAKRDILQFRPTRKNYNEMKETIELISNSQSDYLMFMLHSSEFMPGGSPTFTTKQDIEELFKKLDSLFRIVANSFQGMTIGDYAKEILKA